MAKARAMGILAGLAGLAALASAAPALADVKDGVDAWSRGDWPAAIAEWQGPASAGDPDAMFNMGQAYRLGRGVPADQAKALDYFARAAEKGHIQAADIYGLLLFQNGQREAALPYIQDAARRGDPRAQYLLGIAHFNGDIVTRDWVRAYALVSLANGQGLPQAAPALAEMDQHIPMDQRQMAASLAVDLRREAEAARARELTAAEFALSGAAASASASDSGPPGTAPLPTASPRVPQAIASVDVEPSVATASAAAREAKLASGTEDPTDAGADFARPAPPPAQPQPQFAIATAPKPPAPAPASPPPQPSTTTGPWKVQLGAFSVAGNAERLWNALSNRSELAGRKRLLVVVGGLTRLQAGGYATRAEAVAACGRLKQAGHDCLVIRSRRRDCTLSPEEFGETGHERESGDRQSRSGATIGRHAR